MKHYDEYRDKFGLLREAAESLLRQRRFHDAQALLQVEAESYSTASYSDKQRLWAAALDNVIPKPPRFGDPIDYEALKS